MFRVLNCLVVEHDLRLVVLAGIVCYLSALAAMTLLQRAVASAGGERALWIVGGGVCTGYGIWATHFIAMLAYTPGSAVGFEMMRTAMSLLVAIAVVTVGLGLAATLRDRAFAALAGAVVGLGIATMHFLGMKALQVAGTVSWQADLVVASMVLGVVFSAAAMIRALADRSRRTAIVSAALLTLGVIALHFTAMGAVVVTPDPARRIDSLGLSPMALGATITVVSVAVLLFFLGVAMVGRRSQEKAEDRDLNFRVIVEGVKDYAICMLDASGIVTNWNAGAQFVKGYTADEIVGRHFSVFHPEADRRAGRPEAALATALAEGRFEAEGERVRKDGSRFFAHVVIDPVYRPDGSFAGFAKITRDISRQKLAADSLAATRRNLDLALANMSQGLCLFDRDERLVLWNIRFLEILGLPPTQVVAGMTFRDLVVAAGAARPGAPEPEAAALAVYHRHREMIHAMGGGAAVEEYGPGVYLSIIHRLLPDGGFVTTFEDITERRQSEARISHMALHDGLTGLPNRSHFNDRLDAELERARNEGWRVAVAGIDLDRFKEVNDLRGHAAGDRVLQEIAARLGALVGEGEFIARFGGDEFAAIKRFTDDADLHGFLARLEGGLFERMEVDGFEVATAASIGVAVFPQDAREREQLIGNADLAMYRAKASFGRVVCFYEARMDEAARTKRAIAQEIWGAVERSEFQLYYQVQKSVADGRITGYEVLLRWQHPERGMVSPADFIPVAEECGAILPLGEWVLREACRQAAAWEEPHKIAVNLSPVQLTHVDLATTVHAILVETGLAPHRLELEITESSIIADKVRALHILRQIKALGVTIAIDDFGTGYSSLETLRAFPFDKIKLDRSFMAEVETDIQAKAIIRAILALGRSLEVPVLAEGVESPSQLDLLRLEGCDEAQGYLLGRPSPYGIAGEGVVAGAGPGQNRVETPVEMRGETPVRAVRAG